MFQFEILVGFKEKYLINKRLWFEINWWSEVKMEESRHWKLEQVNRNHFNTYFGPILGNLVWVTKFKNVLK